MDLNVLSEKRVALINLGCKVNSYETEAIRKDFERAGALIVAPEEVADVYVVNTCSVTNMADRKSRQMLHRVRKLNDKALIVATGCYAQAQSEAVWKSGDADIVIGTNLKDTIVRRVAEVLGEASCEGAMYVTDLNNDMKYMPLSIDTFSEHSRAFIKVQDGCNQFCSYCIIPYTRGRVRSRSVSDTLEEVHALARAGYREVVLTGIHLSSYGVKDYEKSKVYTEEDREQLMDYKPLLELIKAVSQVEGIERIRLGSLEPRIICDEFISELAALDKVCPQFHLSLQSGSDEVLKKMNRHYTMKEYSQKCEILRKWFDRPAITTDVIAGFPGETDEFFEESIRSIEAVGFAKTHVFKYSKRQGTPAARQPQVPDSIATARSNRLLELDGKKHLEYVMSFAGETEEILIERPIERAGMKYLTGLTKRYVEVLIPAETTEAGVNDIVKVRVDGYTQEGELLAHEE